MSPRNARNPLPVEYGVGVITWRCSDPRTPCAVLRGFVAATGYTLLRAWHAPEVEPSALLRRRGAKESRSPVASERLPLDQTKWPDGVDLELPCRHGAGSRVGLDLLRENLAELGRTHRAVLGIV